MRYAISQHCFQTVHTKCMAKIVEMRSTITFASVHNSAVEEYIPEVVVYSSFFIMPRAAAALKEILIRHIDRMYFPSIPFDVLHYRTAYRDITVLVVLRIYDMEDVFIHIDIFHS